MKIIMKKLLLLFCVGIFVVSPSISAAAAAAAAEPTANVIFEFGFDHDFRIDSSGKLNPSSSVQKKYPIPVSATVGDVKYAFTKKFRISKDDIWFLIIGPPHIFLEPDTSKPMWSEFEKEKCVVNVSLKERSGLVLLSTGPISKADYGKMMAERRAKALAAAPVGASAGSAAAPTTTMTAQE